MTVLGDQESQVIDGRTLQQLRRAGTCRCRYARFDQAQERTGLCCKVRGAGQVCDAKRLRNASFSLPLSLSLSLIRKLGSRSCWGKQTRTRHQNRSHLAAPPSSLNLQHGPNHNCTVPPQHQQTTMHPRAKVGAPETRCAILGPACVRRLHHSASQTAPQ